MTYSIVSRFKEKAIELSKIFKDQQLKSLDKAIYWIEYVIRHNGAHHLKTTANQFTLLEFFMLDDLFVIVVIGLIIFAALCFLVKTWKKIQNWKSKRE